MITALQHGDNDAFAAIYNQHKQRVYGYFKKKTGCEADAEDLLQITFLKLWKYRTSLNADYLPEQHLFQIAKTVFIDYLRQQNKASRTASAAMEQAHAQTTNQQPAYAYGLQSQLATALSAMPETRRKVFELNRLQGYSYSEVATLLSIPVKAVDNHLVKALQRLRKTFVTTILVVLLAMFFL